MVSLETAGFPFCDAVIFEAAVGKIFGERMVSLGPTVNSRLDKTVTTRLRIHREPGSAMAFTSRQSRKLSRQFPGDLYPPKGEPAAR